VETRTHSKKRGVTEKPRNSEKNRISPKMMNRKSSILMSLFITLSLLLIGCNGSVKGKWSEADKESFRKDILAVKEIENFGENKTKWIECYLSKCEATFSSYFEADHDEEGCKKIATECNNEVLSNGSVKGTWSEIDKEKFRQDMLAVEELSNFGENKMKWIECYLSKSEVKFSSYYEANQDEKGCAEIATECTKSISL
jgi:hypothetical protein